MRASEACWCGATAEEPGMKIAYLLKTFPKLSETFILNEILELERQGLELHIFSLRQPSETKVQPGVAEVRARITHIRPLQLPPPPERVPLEKLAYKVQKSEERRSSGSIPSGIFEPGFFRRGALRESGISARRSRWPGSCSVEGSRISTPTLRMSPLRWVSLRIA